MEIIKYDKKYEEKWDKFVMNSSDNGNFLQTRRFLNYHPVERFKDCSVMVMKGTNIVAVLPGCEINREGKKIFYSHLGSTFGGIVIGHTYNNVKDLDDVYHALDDYLKENKYSQCVMKMTSSPYANGETELLNYFCFLNGYKESDEVGFYIDFNEYLEDVLMNLTSSRRRDYKYSLKNEFSFKEITSDQEITDFYNILCNNLAKFDTKPVHTLEELLEFKNVRLIDEVAFFAVYLEEEMVAGAMMFCFGNKVFHTQYLATNQEKLGMYANEYMYINIIEEAKKRGFKTMSFGTSTYEQGRILNKNLAMYKEGYGCKAFINRTFEKEIE